MTRRTLSLAIALGVLGGAALVLSALFVTGGGRLLVLPWAAIVLGITVVVRTERISSFGARFTCSLIALVLASLSLYVAILMSPGPHSVGFVGHAWRIGLVVVCGAAVSIATARISSNPHVPSTSPA